MSVQVKDKKVSSFVYFGGDFSCSDLDLVSLKGTPREISGDFYCGKNSLTSLKDGPVSVSGCYSCFDNKELTDLSDLPSNARYIYLRGCHQVIIFPTKIDTFLKFLYPENEVRARIKQQVNYKVIEEDNNTITVELKGK